jgi:predicted AlkP superfamily pyrophosphatase or phosphodiesterase
MKKYLFKSLCYFFFISQITVVVGQTQQNCIENRINKQEQNTKPYVILLSIDGLRYDYINRFKMTFLNEFSRKGALADYMLPSYPSSTFANHYSIVSGLYPSHHGIVGNNMYDKQTQNSYSTANVESVRQAQWYKGTPLWVLAEQQGMLSACYFWPGSEASIQGISPTYYFNYNQTTMINERIDTLVSWLKLPEEKRPHLITFYMPELDQAGHIFGPNSPITALTAQYIDLAVEKLITKLSSLNLPINFVILSDHGMLALNQEKLLSFPKECYSDQIKVVENGTYVSVFVNNSANVDKYLEMISLKVDSSLIKVYKKNDLPKTYHFSEQDDIYGRIGDIVLIAEAPYYFTNKKVAGAHGYDPLKVKEMRAMFMAVGPNIKEGEYLLPFDNVDVYPFIAKILNLEINQNIDGGNYLIENALKKENSNL